MLVDKSDRIDLLLLPEEKVCRALICGHDPLFVSPKAPLLRNDNLVLHSQIREACTDNSVKQWLICHMDCSYTHTIYIYIYTYYIYTFIDVCTCMYVCMHVCMCMYGSSYVRMSVCMYIVYSYDIHTYTTMYIPALFCMYIR